MLRRMVFLTALLAVLLTLAPALAQGPPPGKPAPVFQVESGDEKPLGLSDLRGKVVVLFYEKRDQVETNRALKKELNGFYKEQPAQYKGLVVRLAVVDCAEASWPFKGFWRDGLKEAEQKEGVPIYGDWDGKMRADYKLPDDQPSFLVLGPGGKVLFFASGEIGPQSFKQIKLIIAQATLKAAGK